jgi:hypothetical protein
VTEVLDYVREAPRILLLEKPRAEALHASGLVVFAITLVGGGLAIAWIARTVRSRNRD